jgi:hypothetical protein
MIDEIPIIGVTERIVDGLQRRSFAEELGHRAPSRHSTGRAGWGREEWGTGNLNSWSAAILDENPLDDVIGQLRVRSVATQIFETWNVNSTTSFISSYIVGED